MENTLDVYRRYWPCADGRGTLSGVDAVYTDTALGYESALNELPQEFYLHELMDIDTCDIDKVETFTRRWGMPYHPVRYCDLGLASLLMAEAAKKGASINVPLGDTEEAAHGLAWKERQTMPEGIEKDTHSGPYGACVSLLEATYALEFMQRSVSCLMRFLSGETLRPSDKTILYSIGQCAMYSFEIYFNGDAWYGAAFSSAEDGIPPFTLTNAIANQIIETAKDRTPYRRCAWCGRSFKYRRSDISKPAKTPRKQSSSLYCCQKCYQSMKDYRAEKIKSPPDWWTPEQKQAEFNKGKRSK